MVMDLYTACGSGEVIVGPVTTCGGGPAFFATWAGDGGTGGIDEDERVEEMPSDKSTARCPLSATLALRPLCRTVHGSKPLSYYF